MDTKRIRNIAIIAHVDHGKTTLVDQLLRAGGAVRENQKLEERAMDSGDLEREKGITIKAKNTSIEWNDYLINIVDTPGHADFGGEVERVMKMVDGVLLLVDAFEGPQAQTRFVLRKALEQNLTLLVAVNKIDREASDPIGVHDKVLELLLELNATEKQFDAPFFYGSARDAYFMTSPDAERKDVLPLLEGIVEKVPPPEVSEEGDFVMLVSNIDWDDYVGRIAIGRIESGQISKGDNIHALRKDGRKEACQVTRIFSFTGLGTEETSAGVAGNIIGLSGFREIDIGDTLAKNPEAEMLPFVEIDPPTVQMQIAVNDSPFAGREGDYVTSRQIADRLERETRINVSIEVSDGDTSGVFNVRARGAMQIAVLVEEMRREGYELLVSRPSVIIKRVDDRKMEPFETIWIEVPSDKVGGIMSALSNRQGRLENMTQEGSSTIIEATVPTRGLIGFEFELVNLTSGEGVMSRLFKEYAAYCGEIQTRRTGTLVSMDTGPATPYSLFALEDRGKLFVAPGEAVYEGQIVGENPRANDLPVNPTKEKHLTNHRSSGDGKGIQLSPPIDMSLERAIEYIEGDEFVEITPKSLRLRKRILCPHERRRMKKQGSLASA